MLVTLNSILSLFNSPVAFQIPHLESDRKGMGRSNNQRRRTAKSSGGMSTFVAKHSKSKTKQLARKAKQDLSSGKTGKKKLSYSKIVSKQGKITSRKFAAAPTHFKAKSGGKGKGGKSKSS
jgi:hypothetical protein